MKPFSARGLSASERIFNYRLSRARRVVENSFGILTNRFRILRGQMQLQPDTACLVVLACCALHNFLRSNSCANAEYEDDSSEDKVQGSTIDSVRHEPRLTGAGYNSQAKAISSAVATVEATEAAASVKILTGAIIISVIKITIVNCQFNG